MEKLKERLLTDALALQQEMLPIRRELHQHPETGFELDRTLKVVEQSLIDYGYHPVRCGKAGLTATIGTGSGKTFLLRSDMDALPIVEETDLPFKATNQNMHACGHDVHTTMLLMAAKLLKKYESAIEGTVKLMFQPAEELLLGAKDMIAAGVLENPTVDAGAMLHILPGVPFDVGTVMVANDGPSLASCIWFEIIVSRADYRGSAAYMMTNPIIPASQINELLQGIISQDVSVDAKANISICQFSAGRTANVIPNEAILKGTIRTYDTKTRDSIKARVVEISEQLAEVNKCRAEVHFLTEVPTLENDPELVALAENTLPLYLGANKVLANNANPQRITVMGAEDFAFVSQEIPTVMLSIVSSDSRSAPPYPLHHEKITVDEAIIPYGAAAHVSLALNWLKQQA